ncbi:MAG: FAD binding domain-containing protein [Myxococcales bacterium]|nr:FAD binding domain-containing protein [Myxococcales bacterium]
MNRFQLVQPLTVEAAMKALSAKGSVLRAGGVDLIDQQKEYLIAPTQLVDLRKVPGLAQVTAKPGHKLALGPMATLSAIASDAELRRLYPAIAEAAEAVATPQIRRLATLGGNLCQRPRCWYFRSEEFHCLKKGGDKCFAQEGENVWHALFENFPCAMVHPSTMALPLIAHDATIELVSASGKRSVSVESFFVKPEDKLSQETQLKPGEIITALHAPAHAGKSASLYVRLKHKQSFDWPLIELALWGRADGGKLADVRVALGAVAPIPLRAKALESALKGLALDPAALKAKVPVVRKGARALAHNGYKIGLLETTIARALDELVRRLKAA